MKLHNIYNNIPRQHLTASHAEKRKIVTEEDDGEVNSTD